MPMVNQQGQAYEEQIVRFSDLTLEERKEAVDLLFEHLLIRIVRHNAGYGTGPQLELRQSQ